MIKRILYVAAFLVTAFILFIAIFAPQVIVLFREGFPDAEWPASGNFATVAGAEHPTVLPAGSPASRMVQKRLQGQDGKAILMLRDDGLLVEYYGDGYDRDTILNSYSLVKSLVGILTLKALADHKIDSLDDSLENYLGSDAPDITIREALTMTSGLRLDSTPEKPMTDDSFSPFGGLARLHAYGLDRVMSHLKPDPEIRGTFSYESVNTALLGRLLEVAYDQPLPQILSREIWVPAGAASAHWRSYPGSDEVSAYCCLYARPIDWLLVGRYLMENGTVGDPFLPTPVWQEFFSPKLAPEIRSKGTYGLHNRHDVLDREGQKIQGPFSYFFGHNGQIVYFMPQEQTIVVRFGAKSQLLHSTLYELFADHP